jgi:NAD+ synthetase
MAQIDVLIGDFDAMQQKYWRAWRQAQEASADLLVLPELATTGYPPRDLLLSAPFVAQSLRLLDTMAEWTAQGPAILLGAALPNPGFGQDLFNAGVLLQGGRRAGEAHKTLLPVYDVFDEARYFEPASHRAPIAFGRERLGVTICEDLWVDAVPTLYAKARYEVDPCAELARAGASLFVNLSASPFAIGKAEIRRALVTETARRHGTWMVYLNQVGAHDDLLFDGHSLVVDPRGRVVRRLARFAEDFAVVEVCTDSPLETQPPSAPAETARLDSAKETQEVYDALVLGIRGYVHKTGFRAAVVGLSGGIDSAVVAALACAALGPENVHGYALPTRYSSHHALEDAKLLASNLGMPLEVLPVEGPFCAVLEQLEPTFGNLPPDLAEENIQARLRGVALMAIANKFGRLLLSTSNKSEAAVGYSTLYGDMCGALAPIGDVTKGRVYALAHHINAGRERIPARSITKAPSAELRPNQTDQDTLPPYDEVDAVVEAFVERGSPVGHIVAETGIPTERVEAIVRMIRLSEYKRRQAPPILRITHKAFGPGRRMPLAARGQ